MTKTRKAFHVLKRSHIDNALHNAGDIVITEVNEDFQCGANLREADVEPEHTEEQRKQADEAAERREQALKQQEEHHEPKPEPAMDLPAPNAFPPPAAAEPHKG